MGARDSKTNQKANQAGRASKGSAMKDLRPRDESVRGGMGFFSDDSGIGEVSDPISKGSADFKKKGTK